MQNPITESQKQSDLLDMDDLSLGETVNKSENLNMYPPPEENYVSKAKSNSISSNIQQSSPSFNIKIPYCVN